MSQLTRLVAAALCATLWLSARAVDLRVVGTDLLGVEFSKTLYRFAVDADVRLALAFDGSRPGLDELKAGRADAALLVFGPGEESGAAAFARWPLAYHRAVVLVPADAPLEQMTLDQLEGVFCGMGVLNLSTWGDLGLRDAWEFSTINPQVPVVGTGLAAEIFRHTVLHGRAFRSNVLRYDRPAVLAVRFGTDSRVIAIAAASLPPKAAAKVLAVSMRAGEPAFLPTLENIHHGDYPLRLPLSIVFRRENLKKLTPLLGFLFSDTVATQLERADLAPLPTAARRQQTQALEKPGSVAPKTDAK